MLNAIMTPERGCVDRLQTGRQLAVEVWHDDGAIDRRFVVAMPRARARALCGGADVDSCPADLPVLDPATAADFAAELVTHGWHGAVDRALGFKRPSNRDARTVADRYWEWSPVGIDCAVPRIVSGRDVNQAVAYCQGQTCLVADRLRRPPWRTFALVGLAVGAVAVVVYRAR